MKDIVERVTETKKRPEMLEELDKQIGLAKTFMEFMTNGSLNGVFTETEVDGIKKLLKDTEVLSLHGGGGPYMNVVPALVTRYEPEPVVLVCPTRYLRAK